MKKWYIVLCACFVVPIVLLFGISLFDRDKKSSGTEELAQFPEFSVKALFNGDFTAGFEQYFADQFPLRNVFMSGAKYINSLYTLNFGREDIQLDVDTNHNWEHGASVDPENDDDVIQTVATSTSASSSTHGSVVLNGTNPPEWTSVNTTEQSSSASAVTSPTETTPEETLPPETTWQTSWVELESPWEDGDGEDGNISDYSSSSGIVIIDDRAMERVYGVESNLDSYTETVNRLYSEMGGDVRVFAMLVPKAIEFWAPASYRSGAASQLAAINYAYSNLTPGIICVDAYSELYEHRGEAIYYRTDHHWSQRGAYYGFRAFCNSANLTAYELSDYVYEVVPGFLGTMYTFTMQYAASDALKNSPDDVEIFRPVTVSTMEVFSDRSLSDGATKNIIYSYDYACNSLGSSSKYLAFLGGDRPICHIENPNVSNGRKLLLLKESYGNAISPFLGDVFEEVWMIDPRSFNGSGEPVFTDLAAFAKEKGITDVLVLNNVQSAVPSYMSNIADLLG